MIVTQCGMLQLLAKLGCRTVPAGLIGHNEPSDAQRMYLINSTEVRQRIENSPHLSGILDAAGGDRSRLIEDTYMLLLSRHPTALEQSAAEEYLQSRGSQGRGAFNDLAWALVNSKEFLCRH